MGKCSVCGTNLFQLQYQLEEVWVCRSCYGRTGIGSSEAAAACGLSPFADDTPLDLYCRKLGLLPPKQVTSAMAWGQRLQAVVAAAYDELTGSQSVPPTPVVRRHPDYPWMFASPDLIRSDGRLVELKTARSGEGWGESGSLEIPVNYLLQVQHQLCVCGGETIDVCVLIGGSEVRTYTVPRHQHLIELLVEREATFWQLIKAHQPPTFDWRKDDARLLDLIHPPDQNKRVAMSADARRWVQEWEDMGDRLRIIENFRADMKKQILAEMKGAAIGLLADGREVVRKEVVRKEHVVRESKYVDFRIRNAKEK